MNTAHIPWLSIAVFLPLAVAVLMQVIPTGTGRVIRWVTLAGTLATFGLVGVMMLHLNPSGPAMESSCNSGGAAYSVPLSFQFSESQPWISAIGACYHVGIDGISGWLLLLNAGLFFAAAVMIARNTTRLKFYCGLLLLTETATAGVLVSLDLLLFYLFWEAMLIPLYFILSNYGGKNRGRATLKFLVYTVAGSLLMLLAIIYLHSRSVTLQQTGAVNLYPNGTFDIRELLFRSVASHQAIGFDVLGHHFSTLNPAQLCFLSFALAFAIKVPLVPFHTWLPDLYESCPPGTLVFFAGIVSKLGAYGFIRYCLPLFPQEAVQFRWIFCALAVFSILYGALMALGEVDIKRIVAYASISHLGFVVLGIFTLNSTGINGAVLQMVNHGIIIAGLFIVAGYIEARTGTRDRHEIAGLERRMPWLYVLFMIITLAGLGMPGMNGFAGEFAIMLGAFQFAPILAVLAGGGVVLACWYMLRLHQGLMHEPLQEHGKNVRDLSFRESLVLVPLAALTIVLGVFPKPVTDLTSNPSQEYVTAAHAIACAPDEEGTPACGANGV